MSRLENRVKPILLPLVNGSPIRLTRYDQEILATWIAMKFQICEFDFPDSRIVTPELERSLLMRRQMPPDIMTIWIGRYQGVKENSYFREAGSFLGDRLEERTTQSQTFIMGELFVNAMTTTVPGLSFQPPPDWQLFQIWPFQRDFEWPPPSVIDDGTRVAIENAYGRTLKKLWSYSGEISATFKIPWRVRHGLASSA